MTATGYVADVRCEEKQPQKNIGRADHRGGANNLALPACRIFTHIQRIMQRQPRSWIPSQELQFVLPAPAPSYNLLPPPDYAFVLQPLIVCTGSEAAKTLRATFFVPVQVTRLRPQISDDRCRHTHPHLSFLD